MPARESSRDELPGLFPPFKGFHVYLQNVGGFFGGDYVTRLEYLFHGAN